MSIEPVSIYDNRRPNKPEEDKPSFITKIKRIWELVYELGIKEIGSVLKSAGYYFFSFVFRKYNITPKTPEDIKKTTKVIIFLHGLGGGSFCFFPMAKKLQKADISNVYAIDYKSSKAARVPIESLDKMIKGIAEKCFEKGCKKVDFTLIGHSLGALVSYKYIWNTRHNLDKRIKISMLISIAGFLKYVNGRFWWFYHNFKKDADHLSEAYKKNPLKTAIFTIRGSCDELLPENTVHIQGLQNKQYTVKDIGHGGIINCDKTHEIVLSLILPWLLK